MGYVNVLPAVPPGVNLHPRSFLAQRLKAGRDDRGKAPGCLWSADEWGGLSAWESVVATDAQIDLWHTQGANVGIRTGDGVFVLDIDATEETLADEMEADALASFGPAPLRVGNWPKRALVYRINGSLPYETINYERAGQDAVPKEERANDGIEFSAGKRFIVMHGAHPKGGQYKWRRPLVPFDQLTFVEPSTIEAFKDRWAKRLPAAVKKRQRAHGDEPPDQSTLLGRQDLVTAAVRATRNTREAFPTYASMIGYGEALHAASGGEAWGLELWHEFCADWVGGDYNSDVTDQRWETFNHPHYVGAPAIYGHASRLDEREIGDPARFNTAPLHYEPLPPIDLDGFEMPPNVSDSVPASSRFTFLPFNEAADLALGEKTSPLIKGLLDQGAMSVMYGDSNTGKTFVAMDMGFHIGAGLAYAGMKTSKAVVVYIAAEGGRGAKKRLMALREKYRDKAKDVQFYLLASSVNLRDPAADLRPLIEAVAALVERVGASVGFLVVDTMSRALAGGDENSSVDVGLLIKNFDALRAATGAHLMVVHHSGKDRARGARGWSGLRAATDTEIEIADNVVSVGKQRDLDKSWTSGFALEVRTLGLDADGDPITSCTVNLVSAAAVKVGIATATEQDVLDAMATLRATDPAAAHGVTARLLEAFFVQNKSPMTAENLRYYVRSLETKCLIEKVSRGRWVSKTDHPPLSSRDKLSGDDLGEVEESGDDLEASIFD